MRALVYARVSHDPRGHGRSVAEQLAENQAWADREGWQITKVIEETGSASRFARKEREGWPQVAEQLAGGGIDILLTWEASRATRDLTAYAQLRDLCAKHRVLWGYSGTVYDLSKRDARFRTGLDALLSEDESARTSERIQRGVRARAAAGQPHGKLPYGYRREYDPTTGALLRQVPDEETAPIVREIVTRVAAGDSLRNIARDLTARGVPIPRPARTPRVGGQDAWLSSTVKRLATSPTNAGMRVHQGKVVGPASWPALVDRDTWEKACAVLADPARLSRAGDSHARWLLSGIARCALCSAPMRRLVNRGRDTYTCTGCMRVTRVVRPVDAHVTAHVLALLSTHGRALTAVDSAGDTELEQARAELQALHARLDGFTDSAADGDLTPGALARIEARMRPKILSAERKVRQLATPRALSGLDLSDPHRLWAGADLDVQRHIVRSTVQVVIHPAGRGKRIFDPALVTVTPVWLVDGADRA